MRLHRRRLLGLLASATGGLAGCTAGWQGDGGAGADGAEPPTGSLRDADLPVSSAEIRTPLPKDAIPAIVDPVFADDWSGLAPEGVVDPTLPADAAVVGVERDGSARAYPLRILDWHEIVNDRFGGPIAVTYCVLCGSSVVLERCLDGAATTFGVSGQLWRNDLVMYDEATDSRWSQLLATAIRGPKTGTTLPILPSTLTTWGEWRNDHPDTEVLLPPPNSNTVRGPDRTYDYFDPKYNYGEENQLIGFDTRGGQRGDRTLVVGVTSGGVARAYPFDVVAREGVVNDAVGGLPVVVALAPDGTLVAYDRRIGGRKRRFAAAGDRHLRAAGSRWKLTTGEAVDGPHEGRRLERANDLPPMFWEGWSNFHPETDVYGAGGEKRGRVRRSGRS